MKEFKSTILLFLMGLIVMTNSACEQSIPAAERKTPQQQLGKGVLPERLITMDAVRNLRDLGGYKTAQGKELKWGQIYRSAGLHEATTADIEYLTQSLKIKQLIDFRNESEVVIDAEPEALKTVLDYHWIPVLVDGTSRDEIAARLQSEHPQQQDFFALLVEVNEKLVLEHQQEFKQWFQLLLNKEPPFLFHCTEGKDRTGFAAALFLSAMGVERETIIEDYLLTNSVNAERIETRIQAARALSLFQIKTEHLRQLLMVDEAYIRAAFKTIEQKYGSLENYLEKTMDIGSDELVLLKNKFLTDEKKGSI